MGFRGTPRTRTRRTRAAMGYRSTRPAFPRPAGVRPTSRSIGRSRPKALLALLRPFRDMSPQPRTALLAMLPLLGFRALRHMLVRRLCVGAAGPPATARHVRGLATSLAAFITDPPDAEAPERPWALPSKAFSSCARGAPLGVLALLTLLALPWMPFPRERQQPEPPTGLRACDEFVLSPSDRSRPTVDAFLSFSPSERSPHTTGLSLLVTMPALASLGGVTSLPAWTTGLRGKCESAGSSPSCQLS